MLPGTSENVLLCSIPLIDSQGNVFGVCGFEVSAMLFKLAYMPDNSNYTRIFCMLSPMNGTILNTSEAMFAGGYLALDRGLPGQSLRISEGPKSFNTYQLDESISYTGIHEEVVLYPKGSAYEDQKKKQNSLRFSKKILPRKPVKKALGMRKNRKKSL